MIYYVIDGITEAVSASRIVPRNGEFVALRGKKWKVFDVTHNIDLDPNIETVSVTLVLAEKKPRQKKESAYSAEFEALWRLYPKRAGGNPKGKAYSAYSARIKAGVEHEIMELGLKRYVEYLKATNAIGSQYVMQAATFFGPDEHYLNDWAVPVNNAKPEWAKLPYRDEDLPGFAQKHKLPKERAGEYYPEYRARLKRVIEERLNAHP